MVLSDDSVPDAYPYAWSSSSKLTLSEFLTKYKPSMVQDDGTKPWLWVQKADNVEKVDRTAAIEEANEILKETTEKVENIKNDDSIPTRANKKKGIKSKKELREEAQQEATEKLKDVSERHGFVSGKWLIFAPADKVDLIWSTVATSLIEGPLSKTSATLTKVATSPKNEQPNHQHLLCLYLPNVYDKDSVTEVMKILLRNHGLNLSGVKSNLYTEMGLDSKHPSGIQSTVWRNNSLMKDTEIKELKDAFYAELSTAKSAQTERSAAEKTTEKPRSSAAASIPKPKLKKKAVDDDPFASDDDATKPQASEKKEEAKPTSKGKKKFVPKKKAKNDDDFESDHDEDSETNGEKQRVEELKAKKAAAAERTKKASSASKRRKSDEDEDETEPPKKKRGGRK